MSKSTVTQPVQPLKFDNSPNAWFHTKYKLPENPTLNQKIKWHMEHARRCPCAYQDEDITEELKKRYSGKHQDFWIFYHINDHRALGFWAAECAERLLPYFEEKYKEDSRPREAIKTLREWVFSGKFSMPVIRKAALSSHAAAKTVNDKDLAAKFAAHAAGQAVATAHVPTHAIGMVLYSIKLIAAINTSDTKAAIAKEREWQTDRLPDNLHSWVDTWIERTIPFLPKNLRTQLN